MMKAVGGTRWPIARIYLAQALLLGVAAWAVAVPLGIWGSRVLCRYLAVFLNFDITSFAVPAWVYLLEALVGLLVPLLAAAYPVARGTRISVREALADYGVAEGAFGTTAFDRALASVAGPTRPLLLSLRNAFRRRARLSLTLATLSVGGVFFMSALNVRASLVRTIDRLFDSVKYDLTVGLSSLQPLETLERAVRRTPGVRRAEGWIATEATLAGADAPCPRARRLRKRTPRHRLPGTARSPSPRIASRSSPCRRDRTSWRHDMLEGRGLRQGDTNALLVNNALAAQGPALPGGRRRDAAPGTPPGRPGRSWA